MSDAPIPNGYVIIARKIRRSSLWQSLKATHRVVMIELLLQAQFQDGQVVRNGDIIDLHRGQIATSYQMIVDDIGDKDVTVKVVRTALEKLLKHGFLAKDEAKARAKQGLLLTIVNYDIYQNTENYKGKADGKADGITRAKRGQSEGKARAINNNDKNLKKENKDQKTSSRQLKTYAEDSSPYRMAVYLHDKIMTFAESIGKAHLVREANMQKWADSCRKILELDNRDREEAKVVIDWATSDTFWQQNILSPDKLREKYKELCLKMGAQGKKGNGIQNPNEKHFEKNKIEAEKIMEAEKRERESDPAAVLEDRKQLQ